MSQGLNWTDQREREGERERGREGERERKEGEEGLEAECSVEMGSEE